MAKQNIIVVKVSKSFIYTKSMLHPIDYLKDAISKAKHDMVNFVDETINKDHFIMDHSMFDYTAEEEKGYKFNNNFQPKDKTVSLNKTCEVLAKKDLEKKYGAFDPENNSKIFIIYPERRDETGYLIEDEVVTLKPEIAEEMYLLTDKYHRYLNAQFNNVEKAKPFLSH